MKRGKCRVATKGGATLPKVVSTELTEEVRTVNSSSPEIADFTITQKTNRSKNDKHTQRNERRIAKRKL